MKLTNKQIIGALLYSYEKNTFVEGQDFINVDDLLQDEDFQDACLHIQDYIIYELLENILNGLTDAREKLNMAIFSSDDNKMEYILKRLERTLNKYIIKNQIIDSCEIYSKDHHLEAFTELFVNELLIDIEIYSSKFDIRVFPKVVG